MEQEVLAFARELAAHNPVFAYVFFFFNSVLQVFFPPYPGDTLIIFQGYLSSHGILNTILLLTVTLSSTYLSSVGLYLLSLRLGHRLVQSKYIKKFFDVGKIYRMEDWFKKYGAFVIVAGKFIPGVGFLALIAAGIFELPALPAFISIGIATLIHNITLFIVGRFAGNNMPLIKRIISEYNRAIIIGVVIIAVVYIFIKFIYKRKTKEISK
jgi:membrane protein DedA with SNARE-associated domain